MLDVRRETRVKAKYPRFQSTITFDRKRILTCYLELLAVILPIWIFRAIEIGERLQWNLRIMPRLLWRIIAFCPRSCFWWTEGRRPLLRSLDYTLREVEFSYISKCLLHTYCSLPSSEHMRLKFPRLNFMGSNMFIETLWMRNKGALKKLFPGDFTAKNNAVFFVIYKKIYLYS